MYRPFAQTPDIFKQLPTTPNYCHSSHLNESSELQQYHHHHSHQHHHDYQDESSRRGPLELEVMGLMSSEALITPRGALSKSSSGDSSSDACSSTQLLVDGTSVSRRASLVLPHLASHPCSHHMTSACPGVLMSEIYSSHPLNSTSTMFTESGGTGAGGVGGTSSIYNSFIPQINSHHHHDHLHLDVTETPFEHMKTSSSYDEMTVEDVDVAPWDRLKDSLSTSIKKSRKAGAKVGLESELGISSKRIRRRGGLNSFWRRLFPSRKVVSTHSSESGRGVQKTLRHYFHDSRRSDQRHETTNNTSRTRWSGFLTLLFMTSCLLMVVAVGFLVRTHIQDMRRSGEGSLDPKLSHFLEQKDKWWQEAVFYEIFPASFKDSDADGFGDLQGIRSKIPYLKQLGVTGIRLNSIFAALDYPYQYDHVTDFKSVDPHLGNLNDFKLLVKDLHKARLTVILDINPTVTSDQHPWAAQYLTNKSSDFYSSFYTINRENDKPLDLTSSTAYDRESKELEEVHLSFGGHLYLNWSHPPVRTRMLDVFKFWLELGVDGFYLTNIHFIQIQSPETIFQLLDDVRQLLLVTGSTSSTSSTSPSSFSSSSSSDEKADFSQKDDDSLKSNLFTGSFGRSLFSTSSLSSPVNLSSKRYSFDKTEEEKKNLLQIQKQQKSQFGKDKRILVASRRSLQILSEKIRKEIEVKTLTFQNSERTHKRRKRGGGAIESGNDDSGKHSGTFPSSALLSPDAPPSSSFASSLPASASVSASVVSQHPPHSHPFIPSGHNHIDLHQSSSLSQSSAVFRNHHSISSSHVDIFAYFHLIDTFLDIEINQTESIRDQVNEVYLNEPSSHPWVLWNIGSAVSSRLATRIGKEYSTTATFLLMMLPGSVSIFYGDEIALRDSYDTLSNREYRGGQLTPMAWNPSPNGNFSSGVNSTGTSSSSGSSAASHHVKPWIPLNNNFMQINVQKSWESIIRLEQLINFRLSHFSPDPNEKHGNYLFHYINHGEIVMERYFSSRGNFNSHHTAPLQDFSLNSIVSNSPEQPNNINIGGNLIRMKRLTEDDEDHLVMSIPDQDEETSSSRSNSSSIKRRGKRRMMNKRSDETKRIRRMNRGIKKKRETELKEDETTSGDSNGNKRTISSSSGDIRHLLLEETLSPSSESSLPSSSASLVSSAHPADADDGRSDDFRLSRAGNEALISVERPLELVTRTRYVLFASFASPAAGSPRVRDVRDKFHTGTIRVASTPRRMKEFLYFRSLKLDPGEAMIAQVE